MYSINTEVVGTQLFDLQFSQYLQLHCLAVV